MKSTLYSVVLMLSSSILFSCKKDKEEEPIIEPFLEISGVEENEPARFSVTAKIREAGSLPILEHGFLFSDEPTLYLSSDRIYQLDSNPEAEFQTSFERLLEKGKNYYLQAYVRTQIGITYSPVFKFIGGDPPSFQYLGSTFSDLVYYGDTVTIRGMYLPASLDSINVKFHLINAELFNLTDSSFSYTIPIDIIFGGNYKTEGFPLKLRMNGEHSEFPQKLKFKPAIFPEYIEVSMAKAWELPGKHLFSLNYVINGLEDTELYGSYHLFNTEDNKISFHPDFVPNTNAPALGINIRDSAYVLKQIKIRTAEFVSGQKHTISSVNQTVTVNAKDFNTFVKTGNQLTINSPGSIVANFTQASAETVSFAFHLAAPISERKFNLYSYNHGVKGQIPLEITYNLPAFPKNYLDPSGEELLLVYALGFTQEDKVHFITSSSSYVYNVSENKSASKGSIPYSFMEPSEFRVSLNDKFYFSNPPQVHNHVNHPELFQYDPITGISKSVGYLPLSGKIIGSFVSDGRMYYEAGYSNDANEYVEDLWAWNGVYNSEWELIRRNTLPEPGLYDVGENFLWQDRNYRFIQFYEADTELILDKLERFNPLTNKWEFLKSFPATFDLNFRAFSTEDGVYLSNGIAFYQVNPVTLTVKYLGRTDNYDILPESLAYANGKFYYINSSGNSLIHELDITRLKL